MKTVAIVFLLCLPMFSTFSANAEPKRSVSIPKLAELQKRAARFAPTSLRVDSSKLSPGDRQALVKLIEAAHIVDDIFLQQLWSGNPALYARLQKDPSPLGKRNCKSDFWHSDFREWQCLYVGGKLSRISADAVA